MITLEDLKQMEPGIFAWGISKIKHPYYPCYDRTLETVDKDGYTMVKWVAVRGHIYDWCIYHSLDAILEKNDYLDGDSHLSTSNETIARVGAKLYDEDKIKELVKCSPDAFLMYRF